ncbi:HIG1 domain member 2A [Blastocladiella emersonii ATCC 22665]|nr:HIG1 domain member 2A [Blastocladiella emersonii ATCC 22665]
MPYYAPESFTQKVKRKAMEEPLVPLGLGFTVFAMLKGIGAFRAGDQKTSQNMMRWRIAGQGFTLFAALYGMYFYGDAYQKKRLEHLDQMSQAQPSAAARAIIESTDPTPAAAAAAESTGSKA